MALRVLLADNSETIKKVIQLSLQDYAAQVRIVNIGVDVLDVAKSFKPDIVFADVLLQKRSGYDVSADIKMDPELGRTPVVLIWSGFMELDQAKVAASRADAILEKPFDSDALRGLVDRLVPSTKDNTLKSFLETPSFAKTDYELEAQPVVAAPTPPKPAPAPAPAPPPVSSPTAQKADWNMDNFEDINDFQIKEEKKELPDLSLQNDNEDDFSQEPLEKVSKSIGKPPTLAPKKEIPMAKKSQFDLDVPDETDFDGVTVSIVMPTEEITNLDFLNKPPAPQPTAAAASTHAPTAQAHAAPAPRNAPPAAAHAPTPPPSVPQLSEEQIETILRNQSREIIEKVVWKLVPDMAERIIREEIKRLLDDSGNHDMKV